MADFNHYYRGYFYPRLVEFRLCLLAQQKTRTLESPNTRAAGFALIIPLGLMLCVQPQKTYNANFSSPSATEQYSGVSASLPLSKSFPHP